MELVVIDTVVAISTFLFAMLCCLLVYRCYLLKKHECVSIEPSTTSTVGIFRGELAGIGVPDGRFSDYVKRGRNLKQISSTKPLFSWNDHPSLISDAVENGWARFGFISSMKSPSTRSSLLAWRGGGGSDEGNDLEMESSWEVCQGSADLLQKIRFKSYHRKGSSNSSFSPASVSTVRAALPLPGPPLGNAVFPPVAYFEITILSSRSKGCDKQGTVNAKTKEGEKTKLIQDGSELLIHGAGILNGIKNSSDTEDWTGCESAILSLGLSAGEFFNHLKLPGRYPASVGFESNGSVLLDGKELMSQPEKRGWGRPNEVIGCGFDPIQKKVFFTISGEVVHMLHCKSEEFGAPLYPSLGTNSEVQIVVNFGQRAFCYSPGNIHRTANPCFVSPLLNQSSKLGFDDSKELFSMGRIDSQWLSRSSTRATFPEPVSVDFDEESETDLFDIVLDIDGKSPVHPS